MEDGIENRRRRGADEGLLARQHLVKDDAEREEITAAVDVARRAPAQGDM